MLLFGVDGSMVPMLPYRGVMDALPWGLRFVVDASATPAAGGGVSGGLLRRGEEVQAQRDEPPQPVQEV